MKKLLAVGLVAMVVAVTAVVALGAGGSEEGGSGAAEEAVGVGQDKFGVGQVRAGSVAALAQCSDWNEGTEEQKQATIDDIYNQLNQAGSTGPTPDLPDDEAYALFERSCAPSYASGFRLYKLFARAGAFSQLLR